MSPQPSNRAALVEGALRCIEARPTADVTTRDIARAAGANLASIGYHFGSKDALLAHAMEEGFKRWLAELERELGDLAGLGAPERLAMAIRRLRAGAARRRGLVRVFLAALARAPYDERLRRVLARSYADSRRAVAALLALGDDDAALNAAALLLATFDGLLIQSLVDGAAGPDAAAVGSGVERLSEVAGLLV